MNNIGLVGDGLDVADLAWKLRRHEYLWNNFPARTQDPNSPHHGIDDIWVRYSAEQDPSVEHESVWYACAPVLGLIPLVEKVFSAFGGTRLGGVLITRIPPGGEVKPHQDHGWHADFYEKFGVQIESAPGQKFFVEDEWLETRPGDVFWFRNQVTHWVINPTPYHRVTMIICMKR